MNTTSLLRSTLGAFAARAGGPAAIVMAAGTLVIAGCAGPAGAPVAEAPAVAVAPPPPPATPTPDAAAAKAAAAAPIAVPAFGIEFIDTRLSAAGALVDLRYRVLDPERAAPMLDRKVRPVLVHVSTGHRYYVPQPPIVGSLRQTVRGATPPQAGRTYFMLFANPERALKAGDTLALFVGEQRVGEFRIQ